MTLSSSSPTREAPGVQLLRRSGLIWYLTAAVGQLAFVWMIANHYGGHIVSGNYPAWNDKPIIKGYVAGDSVGNIMFAIHMLLAIVITVAGLLQLIPQIRSKVPALHRWNGRLFLVLAYAMALGGLWMTWARPTLLTVLGGIAISIDGILILVFATLAWRLAAARRIDEHRRWAMRTFMVVNGVWFLRVGLMGWGVLTGGAAVNNDLSGIAGYGLQFGAYMIPLTMLELYFLAQRSDNAVVKRSVSGLLIALTLFMAIGIAGAIAFMWGPYM